MKVAVFSTKAYDRSYLERVNEARGNPHELSFYSPHLTAETARLAQEAEAVCAFVHDDLSADVLEHLVRDGVRVVALRSTGFNNVDLNAADRLGITVARVPEYSPNAVAEHTLALILGLNRKIHRAYNRVREGNFALDGLLGVDIAGRTAGVVGTGSIGSLVARILTGVGCRVIAHDLKPNPDCQSLGVEYLGLEELFGRSDIITLHCPLTPDTRHMVDAAAIDRMKAGVMLINTSRGLLVDTRAVIQGLKHGKIGSLGLDVYEEEEDLFFENLSEQVIQDDVFTRLLTFPNVLITAHQAFFTEEALESIAQTTVDNLTAFEHGEGTLHRVTSERMG
jgi:D-lactate dehydrogenase